MSNRINYTTRRDVLIKRDFKLALVLTSQQTSGLLIAAEQLHFQQFIVITVVHRVLQIYSRNDKQLVS